MTYIQHTQTVTCVHDFVMKIDSCSQCGAAVVIDARFQITTIHGPSYHYNGCLWENTQQVAECHLLINCSKNGA